jgi:hypothetical protein
MAMLARRFAFGIFALAACAGALAQTQVYRYIDADGKVVYSDRAPTGDVKDVQTKRVGANFVQTNEVGFATQQASERFPVTLYTFDCGEVCQNAESLLNRRGVPFAVVNVQEPAGQARLVALTKDPMAPVLTVGDKLIAKGYNEARWQALLDEAGYPKTPAQRRLTPVARAGETSPASPGAVPPTATTPATAPAAGTAPPDAVQSATAPPRGGDYPK